MQFVVMNSIMFKGLLYQDVGSGNSLFLMVQMFVIGLGVLIGGGFVSFFLVKFGVVVLVYWLVFFIMGVVIVFFVWIFCRFDVKFVLFCVKNVDVKVVQVC